MKLITGLNLSQILSIITIPVVGYIAAFCYLTGKYTFLNLPVIFVEINTELAILSSLLVLFVIVVLIPAFLLLTWIPNKNRGEQFKPVTKRGLVLTFSVFLVLFIIITKLILSIPILSVALKSVLILFNFALLIIYVFVIPLFQYPNEKSYLSKYNLFSEKIFKANSAKRESKKNIYTNLFSITNLPWFNYVFYPVSIIVWILLSYGIGYSNTQSQIKFPISVINGENYIIAGNYKGNLLLVSVDVKNKVTLNKVLFKPMNETLTIQQEEIGELNQIKQR